MKEKGVMDDATHTVEMTQVEREREESVVE